jgi:hypothetical protein
MGIVVSEDFRLSGSSGYGDADVRREAVDALRKLTVASSAQ